MSKTVVCIAYFFPPFQDSGVHRTRALVRYLPDHGWRPVVVTARRAEGQVDPSLLEGLPPDLVVQRTASPELLACAGRLRQFVRTICAEPRVEILKRHVSSGHVHPSVSCPPPVSANYLMQRLKGKSSRRLMQEYSHLRKLCWGRDQWAGGFATSFLSGPRSSRRPMPGRRGSSTAGSTTQFGHTTRWATRRRGSSVRPATARMRIADQRLIVLRIEMASRKTPTSPGPKNGARPTF
jgi:hypothetical protein